jgi:high affinity sulfate transporter 1
MTRASAFERLGRIAPGLPQLLRYDVRADFRHDLSGGLAVAAVSIPVGVANAQLAGLDPVTGLYASILPPVAYALFGTSRQLVVGPDTATSAMVSVALASLAAGSPAEHAALSMTLALVAGLMLIGASFLRLGALADFLSRPILVGFLNGVALTVLLSQAGSLLGITLAGDDLLSRLSELATRLPETHWPTLAVGLATLALLAAGRLLPFGLPASLAAMVLAGVAAALLGLEARGVRTLGELPGGLPELALPSLALRQLPSLLADAAGLALVMFASGVLSARAFSVKNRYELDTDRELAAFGVANLASAAAQGFCVTGSTSRTAVGEAAGARTQVSGLVAGAAMLVVVLFLTAPLRFVPTAALGAILVYAAVGILDLATLRWMWRIDRIEVGLALVTTLGVVAFGAIDGILFAVVLALLRFVRITARPRHEVLGKVRGLAGLHSVDRHPGATTWRGILIFRFDGPVTFFNADYFRARVLDAVRDAGPDLEWLVLDMIPISHCDVTGIYAMRELHAELAAAGVRLVLAGRRTEIVQWLRQAGLYEAVHEEMLFPTLREALRAYRRTAPNRDAPSDDD